MTSLWMGVERACTCTSMRTLREIDPDTNLFEAGSYTRFPDSLACAQKPHSGAGYWDSSLVIVALNL